MPFTHVIDHQRRYMETTVTGTVTWSDIEAHWAAEVAEGGERYPELMDAGDAIVDLSAAEVRRIVALLQSVAGKRSLGPTAMIVRSDVGFGMIRMLGILVEPFCEIRAFRDRAAAESWLFAFRDAGTEAPQPASSAEIRKG